MKVESSAFTDNGLIPRKYTGFGEDCSPDLIITDLPEGTESLAVTLVDLDVPFCKIFTHWTAWNIPSTGFIPEGLPWGANIASPVHACQGTAWGRNQYRGPKQPFFIRNEHRYVFTVYALNCFLDISGKADRKMLMTAMEGHVLAKADIVGKYKRSRED